MSDEMFTKEMVLDSILEWLGNVCSEGYDFKARMIKHMPIFLKDRFTHYISDKAVTLEKDLTNKTRCIN